MKKIRKHKIKVKPENVALYLNSVEVSRDTEYFIASVVDANNGDGKISC